MKKYITLLGIAVSMYLASDSVANPQTYKPLPEEVDVRNISGDVLVSNLTVRQLNAILTNAVKNTLRDCKTTSMYAYASANDGKWAGRLLDDSDFGLRASEHYITCDYD